MKRITFIIVTVLALIGCAFLLIQNCSTEYPNLYRAELLMQSRPNSALKILQNIPEPEKLKGKEQALYALLYTQAKYKNGIPVKNDSLIQFAEKYYSISRDSIRKAWTYFYLAQTYENMQEPKKALIYFQKADIASKDYENNKFLHLLNFYWGKLLQKQKPYDESIDKFNKAIYYAKLEKDTTYLILSLGELGWTYIWKHNYKKAQDYIKEGLSLIDSSKKELLRPWLMQYLVTSYYVEGEFESALTYSNKYLKSKSTKSIPYAIWTTKGDIFMKLHQYDSAKYYFEKNLRYSTPYEKANYHRMWSKYEEGVGNHSKALEHQKLYATYLDTIYKTKINENLTELQKRYDYTVIKNENNELKLDKQSIFIWKLCISLIIIAFVGCSIYYYERNKHIKSQALHSKNKLMQQLQIMVQEHKMALQETQRMREMLLQSSEVYQKIESVGNMTQKNKATDATQIQLSKIEMEKLTVALDYCFNNFTKRLQKDFPTLTQDDLVICCLIKVKANTSDIIFLLNTNKTAYKKRKSRIKHDKIKLGEETSLNEFILQY